jgi:hypothetical protein
VHPFGSIKTYTTAIAGQVKTGEIESSFPPNAQGKTGCVKSTGKSGKWSVS